MNPYLTVKEISSILGLSRQRIYQLTTDQRKIPFVRIGRAIRVPRTAWTTWLESQHDQAFKNINKEVTVVSPQKR